MIFGSDFINSGIILVEECINYLKNEYFEYIDGSLVYGVFDFDTLTPTVRYEFENWLNGVDDNEEDLLQRLIDINVKENGGVKTRISFKD